MYFRVVDGSLRRGDKVRFMASRKEYEVDELGVLSPNQMQVDELFAGEVGYLAASIRQVADARVGDTITVAGPKGAQEQLPGYQVRPLVGGRCPVILSARCTQSLARPSPVPVLLVIQVPGETPCCGPRCALSLGACCQTCKAKACLEASACASVSYSLLEWQGEGAGVMQG